MSVYLCLFRFIYILPESRINDILFDTRIEFYWILFNFVDVIGIVYLFFYFEYQIEI